MSVYVSDPLVDVQVEYAIAVNKTRFNELELFHCYTQRCALTMMNHEVGQWFIYDLRAQEYTKIKPPILTKVKRSHNGTYIVELLAPALYINALQLDLGYNRNTTLVSPLVGLIAVLSLPAKEIDFEVGSLYDCNICFLPDTHKALRYIRQKEKCYWALRSQYYRMVTSQQLLSHPYARWQAFMRVNIGTPEFTLSNKVYCYSCMVLSHVRQPVVIFTTEELEYGESVIVNVFPIRLPKQKTINLGVVTEIDENTKYSEIPFYEPVTELAIPFEQSVKPKKQDQPKVMDYKKALESKPPIVEKKSNNGTTNADDDGFQTVKKRQRPEHTVSKFDEEQYNQVVPEPVIGHVYRGVIASQNQSNGIWYIFCPELADEIPLSMNDEETPSDLRLSEFIEFKVVPPYSANFNARPLGKFIKRISPIRRCQPMKNSIIIECQLIVPSKFDPRVSQIVYTDYVRRVIDKNGVLTSKSAGKTGKCKVIRTRNTGFSDILFVLAEINGKLT
ncbi:hypothetical protein M3Y94_00932700 [Aphelenchoides besseyi]|nr:hypothetical protein M3Y94_00932700 [Aphelenchoides besseyi]KAI6224975.1 hypothetical protein M3Y95_00809400 [Aphelenchoides besseyi]